MGDWVETRRESMTDGRVRLIVNGELDAASAPHLQSEMSALQRDAASVLLDLSGVTFMDSTGARLLWAAAASAKADGWTLELAPPPREVRRVLDLVGMASVLAVAP